VRADKARAVSFALSLPLSSRVSLTEKVPPEKSKRVPPGKGNFFFRALKKIWGKKKRFSRCYDYSGTKNPVKPKKKVIVAPNLKDSKIFQHEP
jgi:hypothetical protein